MQIQNQLYDMQLVGIEPNLEILRGKLRQTTNIVNLRDCRKKSIVQRDNFTYICLY